MPLATPTLTVVDNEDGTGAVATVAGSSGGSSNAVKVWNHSGAVSGLGLGGTFTRTGDGSVSLSLSDGPHFAVIVSTMAGESVVSTPVYFHTSTASDCPLWRILNVVEAVLQGMSLPGYTAADVHKSKVPLDVLKSPNGIYVFPTPEAIEYRFNQSDDYFYGVMIAQTLRSNGDPESNQQEELNLRQAIQDAFKITPTKNIWEDAGTVPEVFECDIVPGVVVSPEGFLKHVDVGGILLRVRARVSR